MGPDVLERRLVERRVVVACGRLRERVELGGDVRDLGLDRRDARRRVLEPAIGLARLLEVARRVRGRRDRRDRGAIAGV